MASLGVGFILPAAKPTSSSSLSLGAGSRGRHASVVTVGATRGTGTTAAGAKEEKNLFEWVLGALQKDDQLLETDPILKKVEDKNAPAPAPRSRTGPVSTPAPKTNGGFGGFGGLFAKK